MKKPSAYSSNSAALVLLAAIVTLTSMPIPVECASLWQRSRRTSGFIADTKANQRGDLLTVVVDESLTVSTSVRTTTDKQASINNTVTQWLFSPAASDFGTHNGETPATIIDGENEYSGGGTITNRQTFTGRATVQVIDRLPNGNLVIEGHRMVSSSGEQQYLVLLGIVRPYDISADNTVLSSRIANATIRYMTEGAISEAQEKGWLLQINEAINPF